MKQYLWWIENKKGSTQLEWKTKEEAEEAIKKGLKDGYFGKDSKWRPARYEAMLCPTCRRLSPRVIIEGLGECTGCDHIRGDI